MSAALKVRPTVSTLPELEALALLHPTRVKQYKGHTRIRTPFLHATFERNAQLTQAVASILRAGYSVRVLAQNSIFTVHLSPSGRLEYSERATPKHRDCVVVEVH